MKKHLILLLSLCLLGIGQVLANDELTVGDVDVPQGGQATIEVGCEFDTEYTAFELQIALPEGLSLLTDDDGYPVIEKAFATNHILTGNLLPSNGNYKITCRSMDNISIPSSGALFRVTVVADASLTLGSNHTAKVTACEFTRTTDSQGENLDDVDFSIHIAEYRTILDETSIRPPVAETDANIRVCRTIKANEWSTLCLPFAMTEAQLREAFGEDVQLANFTGVDTETDNDENITGLTVKFETVTAIEANHPYIIKVSEAVTSFTVDGVTIEPDEASVDCDRIGKGTKKDPYRWNSFVGTYVAQTELPAMTLFLNGNQFWYSAGATKMKAFRGYFDFYDVLADVENAYSEVKMAVDIDGIATSIGGIRNYMPESVYDLQGRKQQSGSQRKGIYVVNGKKVVIK